jgi:hypothetical protein
MVVTGGFTGLQDMDVDPDPRPARIVLRPIEAAPDPETRNRLPRHLTQIEDEPATVDGHLPLRRLLDVSFLHRASSSRRRTQPTNATHSAEAQLCPIRAHTGSSIHEGIEPSGLGPSASEHCCLEAEATALPALAEQRKRTSRPLRSREPTISGVQPNPSYPLRPIGSHAAGRVGLNLRVALSDPDQFPAPHHRDNRFSYLSVAI